METAHGAESIRFGSHRKGVRTRHCRRGALMNATSKSICVWTGAALLALVAVPSPASAQWARVRDVPTQDVFTIWANGDTLAAGVDTAVYVSTDAGATWK